MLNRSQTRLTLHWLVSLGLLLAFCLMADSAAEATAGPWPRGAPLPDAGADSRSDNELPLNDLDDDPALPRWFTLAALMGLVSCLTLPWLYLFSLCWPPPLRPPQAW